MAILTDIISAAEGLSQNELQTLSSHILGLLNISDSGDNTQGKCDCCRRCESTQIVKYGRDKNGKQRYKCKACNTIFYEDSFSVASRTRHDSETWKKYVELLLNRASLKKCASVCKISVQTAFTWRHKILNALQHDQDNRVLGGIIEADETFFSVSYKGNHTKSKDFTMPREAYKRGTDNRSNKSPKACVMCAVERTGQSYSEVLGVGQPNIKMISRAFENRVAPGSIMLSDRALSMKSYFDKKDDIDLIRLKSNVNGRKGRHDKGKPEVRGIYHIQTVNNLHKRLHDFLRGYLGVSTKYLNHYINLLIWVENHKNIPNIDLHHELCASLNQKGYYTPLHSITTLPAIPSVA